MEVQERMFCLDSMRVCGLMSGTSLDGLDIAIVDFSNRSEQISYQLQFFRTMHYSKDLSKKLLRLMSANATLQEISSMNMYLGELYAELIKEALEGSTIAFDSIDLISSHGQTVWHEPIVKEGLYARPNTLQIGDISVLAEKTGIPVIGDFRTRDMAAGGQGAPLVPFADQMLYQAKDNGRILANIGGISNITVLPPENSELSVIAFDTGPGNMVIDAFVALHTNGLQNYDEDGSFANKGRVQEEWLHELLQNSYFNLEAPKSTGREMFGEEFAQDKWMEADQYGMTGADKIATATMLTAKTLAQEVLKYHKSYNITELFISGGGVHNSTLLTYLEQILPKELEVKTSDALGIHSDAKEAFVFALLGYLGFNKIPNNLPSTTGAKRETILGKIAW